MINADDEVSWEEIEKTCHELRRRLYNAVDRNFAPSQLLSGGIDTSIIASLASRLSEITGITIAADRNSPDLPYARRIATVFNMKHVILYPSDEDLLQALWEVIPIVGSFDPMEIHGAVAVYIALLKLKEMGFKSTMTGDGGDELFAGYTFYYHLSPRELENALKRTWKVMSFSSIPIADKLGLYAKLPYLDDDFMKYAMEMDVRLKVRRDDKGIWGKWILRKAFEDIVPREVIWRNKIHVGAGSGIDKALHRIAETMLGGDYERKSRKYLEKDGVKIRDAEHLLYYEVFREAIGIPREMGDGEHRCPACKAPLLDKFDYRFCRVCGEYPIEGNKVLGSEEKYP